MGDKVAKARQLMKEAQEETDRYKTALEGAEAEVRRLKQQVAGFDAKYQALECEAEEYRQLASKHLEESRRLCAVVDNVRAVVRAAAVDSSTQEG